MYSVFKFLHQVATSSDDGFQVVMKYKEHWKKLRIKFSMVKRVGPPLAMVSNGNASSLMDSTNSPANSSHPSKQDDTADKIAYLNQKYKLED